MLPMATVIVNIVHGHHSAQKSPHEEGRVVLTVVVQNLADTIGVEAEKVLLRQIDTTGHLLVLIAGIHLHCATMIATVTRIVAGAAATAAAASVDAMRTEVESPRRLSVAKIRHQLTVAHLLLENLSTGV